MLHRCRTAAIGRRCDPEAVAGKLDTVKYCPHSFDNLARSRALRPVACHFERLIAALAALLVGCLDPGIGSAQNITTDGSLGAKVTLTGPRLAARRLPLDSRLRGNDESE